MINLASINLTTVEQNAIQSNFRASVTAGLQFVNTTIADVYWLDRLTIYEFWLLQFLAPGEFSQIESLTNISSLNTIWIWDAANNTVVGNKKLSSAALFPSISVVMQRLQTPIQYVFMDPVWASDSTMAWYSKYCETGQFNMAVPYLHATTKADIASIEQHYTVDCATSAVSGDTVTGLPWSAIFNQHQIYNGIPAITYRQTSGPVAVQPESTYRVTPLQSTIALSSPVAQYAIQAISQQQQVIENLMQQQKNATDANIAATLQTQVIQQMSALTNAINTAISQIKQQQQITDKPTEIMIMQQQVLSQKLDDLDNMKLMAQMSTQVVPLPPQIASITSTAALTGSATVPAAIPIAVSEYIPTATTDFTKIFTPPTTLDSHPAPVPTLWPYVMVLLLILALSLSIILRSPSRVKVQPILTKYDVIDNLTSLATNTHIPIDAIINTAFANHDDDNQTKKFTV